MKCLLKPVFVFACNERFFGALQGTIRTLDTHWPEHQIIFYDLGITTEHKELVNRKSLHLLSLFIDLAHQKMSAMYHH